MTEYFFDLLIKIVGLPDHTSSDGWKRWDEKVRSNHPIIYFLLDTAPTFISCNWRWWIIDPIYHFKCKYILKHHHIKIDVNRFMSHSKSSFRNYYWFDSDGQILYATFQILVDFMEEEADTVDWTGSPKHQEIFEELTKLYDWWTKDRPNRDDSYPASEDFGINDIFGANARKQPGYKAWRDACDEKEVRDREYELEDTEMLIRLVTIRGYMWT
ncbi:hypothetical protein LCGC14_0769430 [marine sediment metagenome]|uniref:Uncharacterized protein n=1 Tax=marine sediment metagenome TaxID=412755 RepID=A0A0F9SIV4_9ZZZZ